MNKNDVVLGVNIDHVATLRRLRDTPYPNLVEAAQLCVDGGANQITVHLREDRRHIVDTDVIQLRQALSVPLNLEMAATDEMLAFALKVKPHSVCIVPEKREERTTEGGLDFSSEQRNKIFSKIAKTATEQQIIPSFFIEPDIRSIEASKQMGALAVELHTGSFCIAWQESKFKDNKAEKDEKVALQWERLKTAAKEAKKQGLRVHAGHGIDCEIANFLTRGLPEVVEYNIGHAIVCDSIYHGIKQATYLMKQALLDKN